LYSETRAYPGLILVAGKMEKKSVNFQEGEEGGKMPCFAKMCPFFRKYDFLKEKFVHQAGKGAASLNTLLF